MKHEIFTCDRCGPRTPAVQFMELDVEEAGLVGEVPAAEAGPAPVVSRRVDLCGPCLARVLQYLVRGLGLEPKRLLLDYALKPDPEAARGR